MENMKKHISSLCHSVLGFTRSKAKLDWVGGKKYIFNKISPLLTVGRNDNKYLNLPFTFYLLKSESGAF